MVCVSLYLFIVWLTSLCLFLLFRKLIQMSQLPAGEDCTRHTSLCCRPAVNTSGWCCVLTLTSTPSFTSRYTLTNKCGEAFSSVSCEGCTLQYTLYITVHIIHDSTHYTLQYTLYITVHIIHYSTHYTLQYTLYITVHITHYSTYYSVHFMVYNGLACQGITITEATMTLSPLSFRQFHRIC